MTVSELELSEFKKGPEKGNSILSNNVDIIKNLGFG